MSKKQVIAQGWNELSELTRSRVMRAWLMLMPALLIVAVVAVWPLGRTLWFSLHDVYLDALADKEWVGLANFVALWTDTQWWQSVSNTLIFAFASVSLETILGLLIAALLDRHFRFNGAVRALVLIPWAIPTVVSAKMWGWMLHDVYGVVNETLLFFGLITIPIAWTAEPVWSMVAVVAVDTWKTTPFMVLLLLAAMQMVPRECYEAAKVDGVSGIKIFFQITLPIIKPALIVAIIFRLLDALRVFDAIFVLTSNNQDTQSMSMYARQQLIDFQDAGYGSAASVGVVLVVIAITALFILCTRFKVKS